MLWQAGRADEYFASPGAGVSGAIRAWSGRACPNTVIPARLPEPSARAFASTTHRDDCAPADDLGGQVALRSGLNGAYAPPGIRRQYRGVRLGGPVHQPDAALTGGCIQPQQVRHAMAVEVPDLCHRHAGGGRQRRRRGRDEAVHQGQLRCTGAAAPDDVGFAIAVEIGDRLGFQSAVVGEIGGRLRGKSIHEPHRRAPSRGVAAGERDVPLRIAENHRGAVAGQPIHQPDRRLAIGRIAPDQIAVWPVDALNHRRSDLPSPLKSATFCTFQYGSVKITDDAVAASPLISQIAVGHFSTFSEKR